MSSGLSSVTLQHASAFLKLLLGDLAPGETLLQDGPRIVPLGNPGAGLRPSPSSRTPPGPPIRPRTGASSGPREPAAPTVTPHHRELTSLDEQHCVRRP